MHRQTAGPQKNPIRGTDRGHEFFGRSLERAGVGAIICQGSFLPVSWPAVDRPGRVLARGDSRGSRSGKGEEFSFDRGFVERCGAGCSRLRADLCRTSRFARISDHRAERPVDCRRGGHVCPAACDKKPPALRPYRGIAGRGPAGTMTGMHSFNPGLGFLTQCRGARREKTVFGFSRCSFVAFRVSSRLFSF